MKTVLDSLHNLGGRSSRFIALVVGFLIFLLLSLLFVFVDVVVVVFLLFVGGDGVCVECVCERLLCAFININT